MSGVQTLTVDAADAGARLDRWFKRLFPHIPHGKVEKLLRTGQMRVDGKRVKGSHRLVAGEDVRIPPLPDPGETKPAKKGNREWLDRHAIYEDKDLLAINKPFGIAVQGGTKTVRHIDGMLPEGYRLVHRLDRDTTGVLVIAKHARAAAGAGKAFQSKRAEKTYWAVTNGVPKPATGEIKGYGAPGSKYARTLYHTEQKAGQRAAFVKMRPLTGRTHQLRMHAQLLGAPVAGDPKYLTDRPMPGGLEEKLHLHAHSLVLPRPDGALHLSAPLPVHMKTAFHMLGFSEITNDVDWDAL